MTNKTVLNETHRALGAKMVDFGGWDMPIHYGSQLDEHHQVRRDAGMFDVSHMTVVDLTGAKVRDFLRHLVANSVDKLQKPGKALYTAMLNPQGGVIDDLIVYFLREDFFRLVVNAATADMEFPQLMGDLAAASGIDTGDYRGFIAALENRRAYFKAHGAVSTDHSHADVITLTLEEPEAARIYAAALAGTASEDEATALRRHLLVEMARMSVEDGLVMTLHPAVFRNHDPGALAAYGPDTGHDIPLAVEFTRGLQPLLARYGNADGFHLVLFTLDETVFSREIAPLAGYYRSVYAGVPWWFIDAPEAMRRFRGAVTETAGFTRTSGFIDDTRAFCSIPARHDMSRRVDCGVLAQLVVEHRLDEDEALDTAVALVAHNPRQVFKL